ncbi:hypothetical protein N7466_003478 [Penicillium verhagenii]|uniref:uncharacterized protein n=1 Tax=Penicillium verhagenii TaxID=1562060 RepID=UPI002544F78E|nr:uncharacterized protein N7466_003478 [Penicillium verhagenii]KAJ5937028.1 hypothetical protein N7466_003478 [Penicillium verhagenii]
MAGQQWDNRARNRTTAEGQRRDNGATTAGQQRQKPNNSRGTAEGEQRGNRATTEPATEGQRKQQAEEQDTTPERKLANTV